MESAIPYVDNNGAIQADAGYEMLWGDHSFRVPKGSVVFIDPSSFSVTINAGFGNFENLIGFSDPYYNEYFYRITGDVEITID